MAGIYEELIHSLRNLNPMGLPGYFRLGPAGFWHAIEWGVSAGIDAGSS